MNSQRKFRLAGSVALEHFHYTGDCEIRSKTTVCANRFGTAVRLADFQASAYGPAGVFGSATVHHARSVRACPGRGDATYVSDMRATKFVSLGSTDRKVGLFAE